MAAVQPSLPQPSLKDLFFLFSRVGLTSFGGGTSMWLYSQIVREKGWIEEGEFLDVLALCQALPGINVTNMAVWLGRRLRGAPGAVAAVTGIVALPSIVIVLIASLFAAIAHFPLTELALTGATAAAVALPFSMGLLMARRVRRAPLPLLVLAATFVSVGVLKWPLMAVAPVAALVSVGAELRRKA